MIRLCASSFQLHVNQWKLCSLTFYRKMRKPKKNIQTRSAVNLSYKIVGEGSTESEEPPILLLHGMFGYKKHWKGIAKTIVNMTKRTVLIVDLRNHGGSPHVNSHKYEELAADLVQLLDKLEIEKASMVGHSIGGRAAMCLSLLAPQRLASIVVVDISPISTAVQFIETGKILELLKALDFRKLKKVHKAKKEAKTQLTPLVQDEVTMKAILSNIIVNSNGKIGWMFNLDILIKHFKYIISFPRSVMKGRKYDGPCLFIGGQLSDYIPPDDLTHIRELFPKAVVTYIPKTGHNLHTEDPKSFLELIIRFTKSNS